MAASYLHICPNCDFTVEAWSDGHSYILDDKGKRHFFYHPGERDVIDAVVERSRWARGKSWLEIEAELPQHVGQMLDVIYGECAALARMNPDPNGLACRQCGGRQVWPVTELAGNVVEVQECDISQRATVLGDLLMVRVGTSRVDLDTSPLFRVGQMTATESPTESS